MAEINGCVVSLADGGQVATAQIDAAELSFRIEKMVPGKLFTLATGPDPSDFVCINPFYIVAIQPAAIHPPAEEAPNT